MFFLLRLAFWIGLVLVLLPRDQPKVESSTPQIGAADAVSAATSVINDMSQLCTRQPVACDVGSKAAVEVGTRAQDGAKKVYKMITEKKPDHTGSIPDANEAVPRHPVYAETLTDDDLKIEWSLPPETMDAN